MEETLENLILTELGEIRNDLRDFRAEVAEWKQDAGERVASLETKVTDLYGNGRDGRVTTLEKSVQRNNRKFWWGAGWVTCFALAATIIVAILLHR